MTSWIRLGLGGVVCGALALGAACSEDSSTTNGSGASGPGGSGATGAQGGDGAGASGGGDGGSGATSSGGNGSGGMGDECDSNDDCRLFSSYCETAACVCIPLATDDPDPPCNGMMVTCFEDPCFGVEATCVDGWCTANGGVEGTPCVDDTECADGLKCCYPCGVPDCMNVCMPPDQNGDCPMFP